jgi:uncharacterized protein (TIGR02117 family)
MTYFSTGLILRSPDLVQHEAAMTARHAWRLIASVLLVPVGVYFAAALVLANVPANNNWREPGASDPGATTIYIQSNGTHTGIVMPAVAQGIDWRISVRASDLPDPRGAGQWLAFGWGDRGFYIDTPTWRQARLSTIVTALTGSGTTVVHVDHLDPFVADENWRPLRLRPAEYRRLASFIAATFAEERQVTPGYTPRDVFYPARGSYSALRTCNVWTGNALRHAGVRVGMWTPFAGDVMRWVPNPVSETRRR